MKNEKITIGILIGNICSNLTDDLLNGIIQGATDQEVNMLFFMGAHANCFDHYYTKSEDGKFFYHFNEVFDYAQLSKVDILIVAYSTFYLYMEESKEEFFKRFEELSIPIIIIGDQYKDYVNVTTDNKDGIRKCMDHLIHKHGYRNIVYLSGPKENNRDAAERLEAYREVMQENGLEVTSKMIAYGDYSANSAHLFGKLLDDNPGVEAVVCANDTMAISGYSECHKRGLIPGKNIAITGFDDIPEAKTVTPTLTTIEQNAYDLGYASIKKAIDMHHNGNRESVKVPVYFKHRESCSGNGKREGIADEIENNAEEIKLVELYSEQILKKIFVYKLNIIEDTTIRQIVDSLLHHIVDAYVNEDVDFDVDYIDTSLRTLANCQKITIHVFCTELCKQLTQVLFSFKKVEKEEKKEKLTNLMIHILEFIQDIQIVETREQIDILQRNIWITPFITRDMIANIDMESKQYEVLMNRLKFMNINNAYLFLSETPIVCNNIREWSCPEQLNMIAKIEEGTIEIMEKQVSLEKKRGLVDLISWETVNAMGVYQIFAGNRVYGIMVCEVTKDNITSMYSASLHLGSTFQYMELIMSQRNIQKKLQNAMDELKGKNDILNMISEKDELTGLYNRRGFLEHAITVIQKNKANYILCLYGDLDHLKEINDQFGHNEGDFAIRQAANYLKESLRNIDVIGRIGGDEFAAVAIIKDESIGKQIRDRIFLASKIFNQTSDKPYYVEISIGYAVFKWDSGLELNQMLSEADDMLYESKAKRRKSARK